MSEVQNPLTTLMKKKFGITRQSSLTITENDTPFTTFRKVANYIYKNGDWSENDITESIKNYLELSHLENEVLTVKRTTLGESMIGSSAKGKDIFELQVKDEQGKTRTKYMALDMDNKSWNTQGDQWKHKNNDSVNWYTGNLNYTVGYAKLLKDMYQNWQFDTMSKAEFDAPRDLFASQMQKFVKHTYSGKKWEFLFKPDLIGTLNHDEFLKATKPGDDDFRKLANEFLKRHPEFVAEYGLDRKFSERSYWIHRKDTYVLNFVNKYLQNTYNIVRQQRYEHELGKEVHAKSWEPKKNINKETQQIMDKTVLHQYFNKIELDNDVDLALFKKFEDEAMRLMAKMPGNKEQPVLRLRKLGNHKAAGMYVPMLNTIIVDFRKPSEIYADRQENKKEEASFSSFIHEYGHYLDHQLGSRKNLSLDSQKPQNFVEAPTLSLQPAFANILKQYTEKLKKDGVTGKKLEYFSTPSEAFARAFEVYTYEQCGLRGNLNQNQDDYKTVQFTAFDPELRKQLTEYFDHIPAINHLRKTLNVDTSISQKRHISDERQNQEILKDRTQLANFSIDLLRKWTQDAHQVENLISTTGKQLNVSNPTRVIAYDKWGDNLPELISLHALHTKGIAIKKYREVDHIQAYSRQNGHWYPDKIYSVPDLKEAMINNNHDLDSLHELQKAKKFAKADDKKLEEVVSKQLEQEHPENSEDQIQNKIAKYILVSAHSLKNEQPPFKFTDEERKVVNGLGDHSRANLYAQSFKLAQKYEPKLQQEIKFGINHVASKNLEVGKQLWLCFNKPKEH
ncbi:hypothetical protein [Limosilactobacillus fastidiosus]|uniref:Large polyvalent protein-associated domain-containing protein n=1 Tax=Limosilactobacillus fastidiosus TaxID=2759855 RepID=A0A7W3TY14_9LACO|nr:hypothetical protein [Limosilactobacillus fastidiosus]MBB1063200.1 hypothetical protein [Limosilactobacillus fastidiosus]MBB1085384.1 hypothetical protein [Limosilactobacillus fastidiosus]MCD7083686.1 hypothetical protein [Limosilactobacillus fastidiosus]MCD7085366.1 hypothetical protein [Limosilactobacillus fastidiosus]MCD7114869.1 hypothetical protein [Limosilactobacillus fastidiosus]